MTKATYNVELLRKVEDIAAMKDDDWLFPSNRAVAYLYQYNTGITYSDKGRRENVFRAPGYWHSYNA
jgi:hypothetical protein